MSNNNVAIVSLMAKFDEKSIDQAAQKLGKTTEQALSNIGQNKFGQEIVNQFNEAIDIVKKKLKGVNLSSYTGSILDSLISDKDIAEKTKDLQKFISNLFNLSKSLSGLGSNALNSMTTKQLDAIIAKQEKIAKKNEEIATKTKELESTAKNIAGQKRSVSTIKKSYGELDDDKSYKSLQKVLTTETEFDNVQQKSIKHLSEMLTLYSEMEKVEPVKGTTEAIKHSANLLTVAKEIKKTTNEIDLFTGGKASKFVSENFDSIKKINQYGILTAQQDYVKNGLKNFNAQKVKLEKDLTEYIGQSVQKNVQKIASNAEQVIDKTAQKVDKLQEKVDNLKGTSSSDKPIIDNIVDESQFKTLEELEDRLYSIYDKDSEGDASIKELKEFISLYQQYEKLISNATDGTKLDPELKEEYDFIIKKNDAMQKYADSIKEVKTNKDELLNVDSSSQTSAQLKEQETHIQNIEKAENDLADTQKTVSNTSITVDAEKAIESIKQVKENLDSIPNEKNIKISVNNTDYSSVPLLSNEEGKTVNMFRGVKNAWSGLVNDKGIGFFTDKLELAVDYADELAKDGKVIQANLSLHNPLEVEGNGARWDQIDFEGVKQKTDDIIEKAKQLGYDGVIFKNIRDGFTDTEADLSNVVAVFDALQVKNEQVIRSINAETGKVKDLTQPDISSETDVMQEVEKATEDAVQSKKDFATANEGVQSSIDDSENPLKLEAELMDQIAKSAREAADAKKEFVEANKQVKNSADDNDSELDNNHEKKKQDDYDIQKQKDAFNKSNLNAIDMEIKKREEEAKINSSLLKSQMEQQVKYENQLKKINSTASNYRNDVNGYKKDSGKTGYIATNNYLQKIEKYESQVKALESYVSDLHDQEFITDEQLNKLEVFKKRCEEAKQELKDMKASDKGSWTVDVQKEIDKINSDLSKNSNYSKQAKEQLKAFVEQLKSGNISDTTLKAIHEEFLRITNAEKLAGREGKNFFDIVSNSRLHQIAAQLAGMFSIYDVINAGREGINVVRELDEAMTEVRKVSEATESQYSSFQKTISSTAKEIASTNKELLNSSADFLRLGYSLDQANDLAKNATLFVNVGDGVDITSATEDMITAMKAFDIQAEDSIKIVDDYNQIGNKYALSATDIGEAMKRSASALETGNNTFEESIGLITAMNEIVQNSENTGNTLKVLSLRLRGAKAELESMSEDTDGLCDSTSKLREQIQALTGVDIMVDDNTFKSTADIIKELGAVWGNLTDSSQAATLEIIAGKTRANNVAALLKNYQQIDNVVSDLGDAQGSAERENAAIVDSINGRIKVLSASAEEFWQSFINTDAVKNAITAATDLLNILTKITDNINVIPTLLGMLGSFGMSKLGEGSLD